MTDVLKHNNSIFKVELSSIFHSSSRDAPFMVIAVRGKPISIYGGVYNRRHGSCIFYSLSNFESIALQFMYCPTTILPGGTRANFKELWPSVDKQGNAV
jgi:hypothetical protein